MPGIAGIVRHGLAILAGLLATIYGSWTLGLGTLGIGLLAEYAHKLGIHSRN